LVALKSSEVESFIARPDPARAVVLVFGPDAGLVSERADAIVRASVDDMADPFALVRLDGDALASDPARLIDEATTVPLFGGRRVIRVRAGGRNFVPAVEVLLAAPLRDCRVVIEAGDLRKNAPLRAAVERAKSAVAIPCYADGEREIARLVDDEVRNAKLTLAPDAREMLVPLLGGDRRASRAELQKLILYVQGKDRIEVEDIVAVVADASAQELDALVDAAFSGEKEETERELGKAEIAHIHAVAIVGAALRHCERLHALGLDVEAGSSVSAIVERPQSGIHFRRKDAFGKALRIWTTERLTKVLAMLGEASLDARVHSDLSDTIARRALMAIARGAAQRG
jgi:DNA polymerase-3 subunit delta